MDYTKRKAPPYAFVLEALEGMKPYTRPMFGCLAVYVGEKIVLVLRDKETRDGANGVWIATELEHHDSLRREMPSLRSIPLFGPGPTGWQMIPREAADFEASSLWACDLIARRDPRIGRVPSAKRKKAKGKTGAKKSRPLARARADKPKRPKKKGPPRRK